MEKPFTLPKANRILYVSCVATLCVIAIIIGIVAAANRAPDEGGDLTPPANETETPIDQEDTETGGTADEVEYLCPLSGTVSRVHDTKTPVFSSSMGDWRIHTGLDISAALGDTVSASADGVVKEVWDDALMGKCVSITHEDGRVVTVYKNLAETLPSGIVAGARVKAGDPIGAVGESARAELAEEPHLHFEMTVDGQLVDPLAYLSEDSQEVSLTVKDEVYED